MWNTDSGLVLIAHVRRATPEPVAGPWSVGRPSGCFCLLALGPVLGTPPRGIQGRGKRPPWPELWAPTCPSLVCSFLVCLLTSSGRLLWGWPGPSHFLLSPAAHSACASCHLSSTECTLSRDMLLSLCFQQGPVCGWAAAGGNLSGFVAVLLRLAGLVAKLPRMVPWGWTAFLFLAPGLSWEALGASGGPEVVKTTAGPAGAGRRESCHRQLPPEVFPGLLCQPRPWGIPGRAVGDHARGPDVPLLGGLAGRGQLRRLSLSAGASVSWGQGATAPRPGFPHSGPLITQPLGGAGSSWQVCPLPLTPPHGPGPDCPPSHSPSGPGRDGARPGRALQVRAPPLPHPSPSRLCGES